jgi:hypothetical protein
MELIKERIELSFLSNVALFSFGNFKVGVEAKTEAENELNHKNTDQSHSILIETD